jgi:SsrA-binding protein
MAESNTPTIENRKARFEFHIVDTFEAGVVLQGTEIKSIRKGNVGFTDSFAYMKEGEVWLKDMYIKEFEHGSYNNHPPLRLRKLLLNRDEIKKIDKAITQKGYSLVPLKLYFKNGRVKIEMGLAIGKKLHDKRATIAERDAKRELDRAMKRG